MKERYLQRFAVFFTLLLCLQQVHPYILRSNWLSIDGPAAAGAEDEKAIQERDAPHKRSKRK